MVCPQNAEMRCSRQERSGAKDTAIFARAEAWSCMFKINEITKSIYKAHFPKLEIRINQFRNKATGETVFCVMQVNG